jgi:hypothetical protein
MSNDKIIARVRSDVQEFGWHCLSVNPRKGESGEAFTYTIGLTETFGHPEIMIFGLNNKTSHGILSDCVQMIRDGATLQPDVEYSDVLGGGYKVTFKRVRTECLSEYFGAAVRFYGSKTFSGLVLFWPNKEHLFPWQEASSLAQREALNIVQLLNSADA